MMKDQVFMSHTQYDKKFCDLFDNACANVGMKRFRSEFERISPPHWETIRNEMNRSWAMFLMVGKELVNMQEKSASDPQTARSWKHTEHWIVHEIGEACQLGIDVWVLCDDVDINFPVTYFNNYLPFRFNIDWLSDILKMYKEYGRQLPVSNPHPLYEYICLENQCRMKFKFWGYEQKRPFYVICPKCLNKKWHQ